MGALAQLGERLVCNQEVTGSIPVRSTSHAKGQSAVSRLAFSRLAVVVRRPHAQDSEPGSS